MDERTRITHDVQRLESDLLAAGDDFFWFSLILDERDVEVLKNFAMFQLHSIVALVMAFTPIVNGNLMSDAQREQMNKLLVALNKGEDDLNTMAVWDAIVVYGTFDTNTIKAAVRMIFNEANPANQEFKPDYGADYRRCVWLLYHMKRQIAMAKVEGITDVMMHQRTALLRQQLVNIRRIVTSGEWDAASGDLAMKILGITDDRSDEYIPRPGDDIV